MAPHSSPANRPRANAAGSPAEGQELGLEDFATPDDAGISLDELSQAYAALLKKGSDPYPEQAETGSEQPVEAPSDLAAAEPAADLPEPEQACEITPRSILEAILFVGDPKGGP